MTTLAHVARYLDAELQHAEFQDMSHNGLQVQGPDEVTKIGFAVDASLETFKLAKKEGCQLLITHHGMIWAPGLLRLTGATFDRAAFLIKSGISLYASHLPLDAHAKLGNNAELARIIGAKLVEPMGNYQGKEIAWIGAIEPATLEEIEGKLSGELGIDCVTHAFGKSEEIVRVGLWSGSGRSGIDEAIARGLDLFITGEFHHQSYHDAKEGGLSVIAAGHYATETLGVKALMPVLEEKFGVETVFLEAPTGL